MRRTCLDGRVDLTERIIFQPLWQELQSPGPWWRLQAAGKGVRGSASLEYGQFNQTGRGGCTRLADLRPKSSTVSIIIAVSTNNSRFDNLRDTHVTVSPSLKRDITDLLHFTWLSERHLLPNWRGLRLPRALQCRRPRGAATARPFHSRDTVETTRFCSRLGERRAMAQPLVEIRASIRAGLAPQLSPTADQRTTTKNSWGRRLQPDFPPNRSATHRV